MELFPGTRLGSYEILGLLGTGGMGEVYRARDSRLGREVAVKVVRHAEDRDEDRAERLARFKREGQLLATLSHPHIATLYGADESAGCPYLVMELVPGETLAERLKSGRLRVSEALRIAVQIASALDAAHERGVVHRDLKPANVKITPDGTVKVLDFGLAKMLVREDAAQDRAASPTETSPGTREGTTLGTHAYMSPEQTRGHATDKRTDIWAFGCVLFEALAGRPAFAADTLSDTIARILEHEPDWKALPGTTPPAVQRLLRRCLEKDPRRRLRDMGDAVVDIEEALSGDGSSAVGAPQARERRRLAWSWMAAFVMAGMAAGAAAVWLISSGASRGPASTRPVVRFSLPLPSQVRWAGLDFPAVAVSPDGTQIIQVGSRGGGSQLFMRALDGRDAFPIPGTEDALSPFFSPDAQWVAFFAGGKLKKVPLAGGPAVTLAEAPIGFGGAWGRDDEIIFAPNNGSALWRVPASGGAAKVVTSLDAEQGEFSHRWPDLLPDGRTVIFTIGTLGSWDDALIVAQALGGKERHVLVRGGSHPRYSPTGHLLYARGGALMAAPFDPSRLRLTGTPVSVVPSLMQSLDGAAQFSFSSDGTFVYLPRSGAGGDRTLVWVDRQGAVAPLPAPPRGYAWPRLSPDGQRIAVTITQENEDVWIYDIPQNTLTQITFEGSSWAPVWAPDGSRVTFSSMRGGPSSLFWRPWDTGAEERLTLSEHAQVPDSWSPDGRELLFVENRPGSGRDIWRLSLARSPRLQPVLQSPANEMAPALSPDGHWMAYVSDETGRNEVCVMAAAGGAMRRVSSEGGSEPVWSRDGRELFYREGNRVLAARVSGGAVVEKPRILFESAFERGVAGRANFDVSADGTRFLMLRPAGGDTGSLVVVLEWFQDLRRRVAASH